ncbi:MAG: NapC/NirT family cytochrome c [Deltaproteobacteria bacterium]|jgi:cytochrome c nitrite reductase small subunit|nr:NapC/NirT family cytochrome c [Syntrophaceae bacterium]
MILERATRPSGFRLLALGILAGVLLTALAVGAYHQSGDARVCGSCHSMNFVRDQWRLSNHRQYTCTECHLPDTHLPGKVLYKTQAGLNDLIHETARNYPAAIGLSDRGRRIVNGNCLRCHASTVIATPMAQGGADCLQCHRYLVHGRGQDFGGISVEK